MGPLSAALAFLFAICITAPGARFPSLLGDHDIQGNEARRRNHLEAPPSGLFSRFAKARSRRRRFIRRTHRQKLKKGDLATYAEQQIAGTGWLPAILRRAAFNISAAG